MAESVFYQLSSADPDTGNYTRAEGTPPYDVTGLPAFEHRFIAPDGTVHLVTPEGAPILAVYPGSPYEFDVDTGIQTIPAPTNSGGTIASWELRNTSNPAISLNTSTGVLSIDTDQGGFAAETPIVAAINAAGESTQSPSIAVVGSPEEFLNTLFASGETGGWYAADVSTMYQEWSGHVTQPPQTPSNLGDIVGQIIDEQNQEWNVNAAAAVPTLRDVGDGKLYLESTDGSNGGQIDLGVTFNTSEYYFSWVARTNPPATWGTICSFAAPGQAGNTNDQHFRISQNNNASNLEINRNSVRSGSVDCGTDWHVFEALVTPTTMHVSVNGGADIGVTHADMGALSISQVRTNANGNGFVGVGVDIRSMIVRDAIPADRAAVRNALASVAGFTIP